MNKTPLAVAICTLLVPLSAYAQEEEGVDLGTLQVTVGETPIESLSLAVKKASDDTIKKSTLQQASSTLGNALSGQIGVHSNPFGGGASAPVIRGQDGVRVKILQNGTDVVDVSHISPDHVVTTDTLLANKVDLVRGASTLLYGTASQAGVVNVIDGRIPDQMPFGAVKQNIEGDVLLRYNTANNEKIATAGITAGLGDHFALRVEGLTRKADNYKVPAFQSDVVLDYVPDSYNQSVVGTVGLSYIKDDGYLGASYSHRRDHYGIPGHNHNYDSCRAHIFKTSFARGRYYLDLYPHLMDDEDINDEPHFDECRTDTNGEQHGHSHDNPFGFEHNHNHGGPWVDMHADRYDIRAMLKSPVSGIDKLKFDATYADYFHDEKDPGNPERKITTQEDANPLIDRGHAAAIFKNKGVNARLELHHSPITLPFGTLKGVVGVQHQTSKMSAMLPYLPSQGATKAADPKFLLVPHTNQNNSIFALEQIDWDKLKLEVAARYERQKTPVHYNHTLLKEKLDYLTNVVHQTTDTIPVHPNLEPYQDTALSYLASLHWDINDKNRLSLTASHNERFPAPMELYYHGKHLATNSFEHGNKNLKKEQSNNIELGLIHRGEVIGGRGSVYYQNFGNYIFNEAIDKQDNLYLRRYNQAAAQFYGVEGELDYKINNRHKVTVFGDFVQGKLNSLPSVTGKMIFGKTPEVIGFNEACDGYSLEQIHSNLSTCIQTNPATTAATLEPDTDCGVEDFKDAADICVLAYPEKLGVDSLARPGTYAPRLPPTRLGFRYQARLSDKWSANMEYSRVFAQDRLSTSTIAIRPGYCLLSDDQKDNLDVDINVLHSHRSICKDNDGEHLDYVNDKNPLKMTPRHVQEAKTQGYNLLNVGIDYQDVWRDMDYKVFIQGSNLLNEKIYIHNSFLPYVPQMGRNYSVGLSVAF